MTPLIAVFVGTGYVLGLELMPPGPTFRDVVELEQSTGMMVVENGFSTVRYMVNASVWTIGILFLGLTEYAGRLRWDWLPSPADSIPWLMIPATRRHTALTPLSGGVLHIVVMGWLAIRVGVTLSGGYTGAFFVFGAVRMWVLATIPRYLRVRHYLGVPSILLTGLIFP